MTRPSDCLNDPVVQRFINDPRTFWCDMPKGHGLDSLRRYWRNGGTDGIPEPKDESDG